MPTCSEVVLLHGIGDTSERMAPMRRFLEARGHAVRCLNLIPNNGSAPIEELSRQVALQIHGAVDLVGFSMGGIVARYYVQRLGGLNHVRRLITISSPHHGTWGAHLFGRTGVRQMRRGSAFLRDLHRDRDVLKQVAFTSLWTPFDLTILPASSSVVPGAESARFPVTAHPLMVRDRRVLEAVSQLLSD